MFMFYKAVILRKIMFPVYNEEHNVSNISFVYYLFILIVKKFTKKLQIVQK